MLFLDRNVFTSHKESGNAHTLSTRLDLPGFYPTIQLLARRLKCCAKIVEAEHEADVSRYAVFSRTQAVIPIDTPMATRTKDNCSNTGIFNEIINNKLMILI